MSGDTYGNSLRVCGGCSAWLLVVDTTSPTMHCAKCLSKMTPFAQWAADLKASDLVYLQPSAAWRSLSRMQYVIIERDDDALIVQPLGFPDVRVQTEIAQCADHDVTPWRNPHALY